MVCDITLVKEKVKEAKWTSHQGPLSHIVVHIFERDNPLSNSSQEKIILRIFSLSHITKLIRIGKSHALVYLSSSEDKIVWLSHLFYLFY